MPLQMQLVQYLISHGVPDMEKSGDEERVIRTFERLETWRWAEYVAAWQSAVMVSQKIGTGF